MDTDSTGGAPREQADAPRVDSASWRRPVLLLALIACALAASTFFDVGSQLERAQGWIATLGPWGPAAFILLYATLTVAAVPGSILTLTAGALFGLAYGVAYTFVGAVLGSCGAFLTSRYLARDWVRRRLAVNPRFARMDAALEREGLKVMVLLRLSPVFPYNFLNFALGLSGVRFRDYLLACFAMLPGTLLFVYYGFAAGSIAKAAGEATPERGAEYYVFLGVGLAATVAVTALITRIARKALGDSTDEDLLQDEAKGLDESASGTGTP